MGQVGAAFDFISLVCAKIALPHHTVSCHAVPSFLFPMIAEFEMDASVVHLLQFIDQRPPTESGLPL